MSTYKNDHFLVETDWLANNLDNPNLRLYDCAALPAPNPDEMLRTKFPLKPHSARKQYESKHIPSAAYIDVIKDLTDQDNEIPLMAPPVSQMVEIFKSLGVNKASQVILYSSTNPMWATRVWWLLKSIGFDRAAILNGGFDKWLAEGRSISNKPSVYQYGDFRMLVSNATSNDFGEKLLVDKKKASAAIENNKTLLIHALTPSVYDGSNNNLIFGRRGRIPNSINIPTNLLHEKDSSVYLPAEKLKKLFKAVNNKHIEHVITYCGGGINATNTAFALSLLGYENISVYDGSMCEWGNDDSLPIEV